MVRRRRSASGHQSRFRFTSKSATGPMCGMHCVIQHPVSSPARSPATESGAVGLVAAPAGYGFAMSRDGRYRPLFISRFAFHDKAEGIDLNWFLSLANAGLQCDGFNHDDHDVGPDSSIGDGSPIEFMRSIGDPGPPTVPRPRIPPRPSPAFGASPRAGDINKLDGREFGRISRP